MPRKDIVRHLKFFLKKDTDGFSSFKKLCKENSKASINKKMITDSFDLSKILKIKYVSIISHLPGFGGKSFNVSYRPTNIDMIMQV